MLLVPSLPGIRRPTLPYNVPEPFTELAKYTQNFLESITTTDLDLTSDVSGFRVSLAATPRAVGRLVRILSNLSEFIVFSTKYLKSDESVEQIRDRLNCLFGKKYHEFKIQFTSDYFDAKSMMAIDLLLAEASDT